jgi:hypothetical protein
MPDSTRIPTAGLATMPKVSAQYVAGFLDGEGNITILERNRYAGYCSYGLHVGFTNRNLCVLNAIRDSYGGTIFQKKRYRPNHSASFELRIGKIKEVLRLLEDVTPHLIIKKEQAELARQFLKLGKVKMEVISMRKIHPTKGGLHPVLQALPGEQDIRKDFKEKLMSMNVRGVVA